MGDSGGDFSFTCPVLFFLTRHRPLPGDPATLPHLTALTDGCHLKLASTRINEHPSRASAKHKVSALRK